MCLHLQFLTRVNILSIVEEDESTKRSPITDILLSEASQSSFSRMRKSLFEKTNLTKEEIPRYYTLAKKRPKIEPFIINKGECNEGGYNESFGIITEESDLSIDNTSVPVEILQPKVEYTLSLFIDVSGKQKIEFTDAYGKIKDSKKGGEVLGAKITGEYNDYCTLMEKKHCDSNGDLTGGVFIIESYDGAVH